MNRCVVLLFACALPASADVLSQYTFGPNGTTPGVPTPTTVGANLTATSITANAGLVLDFTSPATQPTTTPFLRTTFTAVSATPAAAVTNNASFAFTVTANSGYFLNLSSLTFDAMRGGASAPRGYDVRSSVNGYATTLAQADIPSVRPALTNVNINLTGPAFQGLSTITFRIYGYSPATGSSVDFDSFTLNGTATSGIPDTDGDGLADSWETQYFGAGNLSQTAAGNPDNDGLTNLEEYQLGTNPTLADTDGDGLTDGQEKNIYLTNPLLADTDGDTLSDGAEINLHLTNPLNQDSDGDFWKDNEEVAAGSNPNNFNSRPAAATGDVHINEFVSESVPKANGSWMPLDMDGDVGDWLELKNNGATAVNVRDWQLTDDPAVLAKWRFAQFSIPAGGYAIVYASGKNKAFSGVQPHTNFKLETSGALILSRPDGAGGNVIVSQIGGSGLAAYPSQKQGASYGRTTNVAAGSLAYFTAPTPGAAKAL